MSSNQLRLSVLFNMVDNMTRPLRNIVGSNTDLARSVSASRDQLKALNRTQRDIGAFRELKTGAAASAAALQAAQERVRTLAATMSRAGPPTRAMAEEMQKARQEAAKLKAESRAKHAQLEILRRTLTAAGVDTRNLSQHERRLRQNITETTEAMRRQQAQLDALAERARRRDRARRQMDRTMATSGRLAGAGTGMIAAGVAAGAAVAIPVRSFAIAEDAAMGLKVALMRAGSEVPPEFQKINDLAMKLGDRLPGATSDFQEMMTMLTRQGIGATSILTGMGEATAYLGVMLKKTPAEAAEFAAKLQDATRTSEKDMMSLMDVIQRSYFLGVDDNNMLAGFAKLSPAMDTIKQKGLEGAKALAPLLIMADQAGLAGESAGNAFRKVFQLGLDMKKLGKANALLAPTQRLDFTNGKMDFSDGKGEFGGMEKMFAQLEKLKTLTTQKRLAVLKELYGDDAETLQAVSLLMEKGMGGYKEVQAKMAAQASMQERVAKQLGTLKNLWEATSGTFTNGLVAIGEAIAPEAKAVTEWLGTMAQRMGAWARENPRLAGGIMKVAAVAAVLLTACGALVVMVAGILAPLAILRYSMTILGMQGGLMAKAFSLGASALGLVGKAILFIGRAMLMNPIGLIITGIAVAAYLIYRYWEPIKGFFSGLWNQVKTAFAGGIGSIAALIVNWSPLGLFYKAFAGVMGYFGVSMPATFTEFGGKLLAGLASGITGMWGQVKTAFSGGIGSISALIANWSPLGLFYKAFAGVMGYFGVSMPATFTQFGGSILSGLANGVTSALGGISGFIMKWHPINLFYQAFAAVMGYFGVSMPAKFSEFGANLVSGLVNGITNGLGRIKDAIGTMASSTVGWFKEKLGIHSPSRVFAQLGGFISEGAAGGIEDKQSRVAKAAALLATVAGAAFAPGAAAAAADLANRLTSLQEGPGLSRSGKIAAAIDTSEPRIDGGRLDRRGSALGQAAGSGATLGAGSGAQVSHNTYNITINAPAGMDPHALSRAVSAELERIERARQIRHTSRLRD